MTPGQLALSSELEDTHIGVVDPGPVAHSEVPSLIDLQVGDIGFVKGLPLLTNISTFNKDFTGGSHLTRISFSDRITSGVHDSLRIGSGFC